MKKKQGQFYYNLLSEFSEYVSLQSRNFKGSENNYWVFGVVLKKEGIRDTVIKELSSEGIETRPFFGHFTNRKLLKTSNLLKLHCQILKILGLMVFIYLWERKLLNQNKNI